jgi:Nuclease-related domain/AAA domain
MIPESPAEGTQSRAELRLFEHLRDGTPDELVAYHHVSWLAPEKGGRPQQGEADFVLAHPERGLLVVEVKGGTIAYDATAGKWSSTGRSGKHAIRDPFGQAQRTAFSLRDLLERSKRVQDNRFFVKYAVAFPDTRAKAARLKPDAPREIVIDGDDARSIEQALDRIARFWRGSTDAVGLSGADLKHVERVLANSFEIRAPLSVELAEEERELLRLTEGQYYVLDLLSRQTRVAIAGCAGSGKTFLAAEKARRLAAQGFRVLVVCFNRFLAEHLRRGLADIEGIDTYSYDALALAVVREAGLAFPDEPPAGDQAAHWNSLRAAFAESVLDVAGGRYGALIVDEAQDFQPDWWLPLQLLLEDPDHSPLYVFLDDNQRIFAVPQNLPVPAEPIQLKVNCRNTQTINRLVSAFYGGATIEARGPEGIPIDRHFYATDEELLAQLDDAVKRWLGEAEVEPEQIALLTPRSAQRSALWQVDKLGGVRLTDDPWEPGRILRSSIHKFKGLERLVVAVAELDGARSDVFYVGFSRPNLFLSIFCPESARHRLPQELAS